MAKAADMKGLKNFIAEIRECKNTEEENRRVEKELAKIRGKFGADKTLTAYDQKKYVWKLLYIHMLGFDVEFGHKQAADLIPQPRYAEKQVGYVACSILLNEQDEFLRLVINSIRNDILSRNEAFQCLSLSFVGAVGSYEMAEALTGDIMKVLAQGQSRSVVKKKAALGLLRLYRKTPVDMAIVQAEQWGAQMAKLLEESDLGLLLCCVTLLQGLVARSPVGYEPCLPRVVGILDKIISYGPRVVADSYQYYKIPVPWLQAKCLRVMQYFDPPEDPQLVASLTNVLKSILKINMEASHAAAQRTTKRPVNRENALQCILFEAITLCLHFDLGDDLLRDSVAILAKFINGKEANPKYLALEALTRLAVIPEVLDAVKSQQDTVTQSLREADVSIRRRAMDLLFTMCDSTNADTIVEELLRYLPTADFVLREELVLKMAIMAERFAPSVQWYVDTTLEMMESAGEYMGEDVWQRVVQLVANNEAMQPYAAHHLIESLRRGMSHEGLVSVAAYVLGEYGSSIAHETSPYAQFHLLHERFAIVSPACQALLLTSYTKLLLMDPSNSAFKEEVLTIFDRHKRFMDAELQQRATEYEELLKLPGQARQHFFTPMPKWPDRQSFLMKRLQQQNRAEDGVQAAPVTLQPGTAEPMPGGQIQAPMGGSAVEGDLLGGGDGPPAGLAAAPPPSAAVGGSLDPLDDLLGGSGAPVGVSDPAPALQDDPFAAQGAVGNLAGPGGIQVLGDVATWARHLMMQTRGVMYEDTALQVGVKCEFSPPMAVLSVFFGNKLPGQAISDLRFTVAPSPEFQVAVAQLPTQVAPLEQVQVAIQVRVVAPFVRPPTAQLVYRAGQAQQSCSLPLPCTPHRFLQPFPDIDRTTFFAHWKQVATEPLRSGKLISRSEPLSRESVQQLLSLANFGCIPGSLDASQDNEASAGWFVSGQQGAEQKTLVQVRIEGNPQGRQQFKVTVASQNSMITSALRDMLAQQLEVMV